MFSSCKLGTVFNNNSPSLPPYSTFCLYSTWTHVRGTTVVVSEPTVPPSAGQARRPCGWGSEVCVMFFFVNFITHKCRWGYSYFPIKTLWHKEVVTCQSYSVTAGARTCIYSLFLGSRVLLPLDAQLSAHCERLGDIRMRHSPISAQCVTCTSQQTSCVSAAVFWEMRRHE